MYNIYIYSHTHTHTPVDLETDVIARGINHLARLLGLLEHVGDELLAAEAGVHGHEEDDVQLVHDVLHTLATISNTLATHEEDDVQLVHDVVHQARQEGPGGKRACGAWGDGKRESV
jgi:hypothetical protein